MFVNFRAATEFNLTAGQYNAPFMLENMTSDKYTPFMERELNRAQVRDILGSPLLADPFHANRWDYVFTIRRQGAEPQLRRVVVLFKGEALESIDTGGPLPGEREFVASIDTLKTSRSAPSLALTDEQIKALPAPAPAPAPEPVPPAPPRSYPPLEPRT